MKFNKPEILLELEEVIRLNEECIRENWNTKILQKEQKMQLQIEVSVAKVAKIIINGMDI